MKKVADFGLTSAVTSDCSGSIEVLVRVVHRGTSVHTRVNLKNQTVTKAALVVISRI